MIENSVATVKPNRITQIEGFILGDALDLDARCDDFSIKPKEGN